ncbi:MAG: protein phosphatase 2C domain-containing protein [Tannerella sp.]|jgi:protein phosphatase|nr:protein phosphatase 2C domain-containing protein [Tannerella sp.]
MQIILNQPYALHEQGGSDHNEDYIYPEKGKATPDNTFFLVCDGVGGLQKGEVASRIVCESFASFLNETDLADFNPSLFEQALGYAYEQLAKESETERKTGTTLTFLCFHRHGALMAHIGDSRIYHLRKQGKTTGILYKSSDHSYVNELVRANLITPEEAEIHSKKNVLTRAMQPHQKKLAQADIYETDDIQAGDYFFLCSDGVLESVDDSLLCEVIASDMDDESKINAIFEACQGHSRDNFSACLIPVANILPDKTKRKLPLIHRLLHVF